MERDMKLNDYRDLAYEIAREHGWHETMLHDEIYFMLVISEVAEAMEADRKDKHCDKELIMVRHDMLEGEDLSIPIFETYVKDSCEDELADVVIRSLDYAGMCNINLDGYHIPVTRPWEDYGGGNISFPEFCYGLCSVITMCDTPEEKIKSAIVNVEEYCDARDIDLWWFVEQKMKYNSLRSYRHGGKKY